MVGNWLAGGVIQGTAKTPSPPRERGEKEMAVRFSFVTPFEGFVVPPA